MNCISLDCSFNEIYVYSSIVNYFLYKAVNIGPLALCSPAPTIRCNHKLINEYTIGLWTIVNCSCKILLYSSMHLSNILSFNIFLHILLVVISYSKVLNYHYRNEHLWRNLSRDIIWINFELSGGIYII